ncbi:hypothetical protein DND90_15785 [Pseudomonas syringae pv. maculicola]|nr:hypothetical protein DND90_15785 [Pseudomonas syringae pv. maculicola]
MIFKAQIFIFFRYVLIQAYGQNAKSENFLNFFFWTFFAHPHYLANGVAAIHHGYSEVIPFFCGDF